MNVEELFGLVYRMAWRGYQASMPGLDPGKVRMTRDGAPFAAVTLDNGVVTIIKGAYFRPKRDDPLLHDLGESFKERGAQLVYI